MTCGENLWMWVEGDRWGLVTNTDVCHHLLVGFSLEYTSLTYMFCVTINYYKKTYPSQPCSAICPLQSRSGKCEHKSFWLASGDFWLPFVSIIATKSLWLTAKTIHLCILWPWVALDKLERMVITDQVFLLVKHTPSITVDVLVQ